jgi:hypothetical protein
MKYDNNKLYLLRDRIDRLVKLTLCPFCSCEKPIVVDFHGDVWYCQNAACDSHVGIHPRSISCFDSEFLKFLNNISG